MGGCSNCCRGCAEFHIQLLIVGLKRYCLKCGLIEGGDDGSCNSHMDVITRRYAGSIVLVILPVLHRLIRGMGVVTRSVIGRQGVWGLLRRL